MRSGHGSRALVLLVLFAAAVGAPDRGAAQAADSGLANRIARLEAEIADLQRHLFAGGEKPAPANAPAAAAPAGPTPARTEIRLQRTEAEMRALTGQVERLAHEVSRLAGRLDELAAAARAPAPAAARPRAGPAPAPGAPAGARPPARAGILGYLGRDDLAETGDGTDADTAAAGPGAPAAGPILPEGDAATRYKHAFAYAMRHDYATAERAFREFVASHGDDPLAGNAMYWLGETYYVRGNFADAAIAFAEGYEKYPGSPKTADNLLKLAFALARMARVDDACVALEQLADEFPNASRSVARRAGAERERIGCDG